MKMSLFLLLLMLAAPSLQVDMVRYPKYSEFLLAQQDCSAGTTLSQARQACSGGGRLVQARFFPIQFLDSLSGIGVRYLKARRDEKMFLHFDFFPGELLQLLQLRQPRQHQVQDERLPGHDQVRL